MMYDVLYSPESLGLSSDGLSGFLRELKDARNCLHGVMIERGGKVCLSAYADGFAVSDRHRVYSISKSFVSAAVGRLVTEGRLSVDDEVCGFFPEYVNDDTHPFIRHMKIRHLLTMETPFTGTTYSPGRADWVSSFFTSRPSHEPGTVFNYDTSASLVLNAVVEKLTGRPYMEYLYDTVLRHIGFVSAPPCVRSPDGYSWGGSGVQCTLPELTAFARLFMDGGRAPDGRRLIDESYIKQAVSKQVSNETDNGFASYYSRGYGYQVWVIDGGFAFLGMGNQLAFCFPKEDVIFTCFSDDQGNSTARETIFRSLRGNVLSLAGEPLSEDPAALARLRELEKTLTLPLPIGEADSPVRGKVSGLEYDLDENPAGISRVRFDFDGSGGVMTYLTPRGEKKLTFAFGGYDFSVFPETHYFGDTIGTPLGKGYRCRSAGCWAEENKLIIRTYITDTYFGNMTITATFGDGCVDMLFKKTAEWFLDEYRGFAHGECAR